jgi:hypothetical protein
MSDLRDQSEAGRMPVRRWPAMRAGWGIAILAGAAVILLGGCSDLPTGFEPEWCPEEDRAALIGQPYHEWPDLYRVRFHPHVDPSVAAPELAATFGFEIRILFDFGYLDGFSAHIPDQAVPLLRCDPRVERLGFVGPPIDIGWYGRTIVRD